MKWQFKNIPKVLKLYWGRNRPLSYLRFLTVKTFKKLNPDWTIKIYYPKEVNYNINWCTTENKNELTCSDYFSKLNVELIAVDFTELDFPNVHRLSEVQKSDVFRWWINSKEGGVWSDFDILYINPINTLPITKIFNYDCSLGLVKYDTLRGSIFPIGFFMCGGERGKEFFSNVYEITKEIWKKKESFIQYQAFGRYALEAVIKKGYKYDLISSDLIYLYKKKGAIKQYFQIGKLNYNFPPIGLHWYAGFTYSQDFENKIHERNLKEYLDIALLSELKL